MILSLENVPEIHVSVHCIEWNCHVFLLILIARITHFKWKFPCLARTLMHEYRETFPMRYFEHWINPIQREKNLDWNNFTFALSMSFVFIILEFIHRVCRCWREKPIEHWIELLCFFSSARKFVNCLIFFLSTCDQKTKRKKNCYSIAGIHDKKATFLRLEISIWINCSIAKMEMRKKL